MRKVFLLVCVILFLLLSAPLSGGEATSIRKLIYSPEEYEGQTIVFQRAMVGEGITKDKSTGLYCLPVEVGGTYIPPFLYHSQLNFVIKSPELAEKLIAKMDHHEQEARLAGRLMSHMDRGAVYMVGLTATVESYDGYWIAAVFKIELYAKDGKVIATLE